MQFKHGGADLEILVGNPLEKQQFPFFILLQINQSCLYSICNGTLFELENRKSTHRIKKLSDKMLLLCSGSNSFIEVFKKNKWHSLVVLQS